MSDYDHMGFSEDLTEPYYEHEDTGWGTCPDCGAYLENWGAVSDGDGDIYDELGCPNCQEAVGQHNLHYYDDHFNEFDDYDDYLTDGYFDDDEPITHGSAWWYRHHVKYPLTRFVYWLKHIDLTYRIRRCADCGKRGVVRGERYCGDCRLPF